MWLPDEAPLLRVDEPAERRRDERDGALVRVRVTVRVRVQG